jgi:uncharacterized membrane protein YedE/YeeE
MQIVIAFAIGLLFGLGLLIAGMANPAKILNFLDVAGSWDPSLAFVMASAFAVTALGYRFVLDRDKPLLAAGFTLPTAPRIDMQLIGGSAVFGIGWGLSGFCPGPVITTLGLGYAGPPIMFAGLLLGVTGTRVWRDWRHRRQLVSV